MPYIEPHRRPALDEIVETLAHRTGANGDLNYILFALCKRYINPSYTNYKNFLGEIHEAECEIRRRLLAPYEDKKIIANGDVASWDEMENSLTKDGKSAWVEER